MDKARRNKELNCLDFFKKDGLLAERVANYEQRPQQYEMAEAVLRALNENRTAIIEAGTGTGKSLAYLIPAITYATEGIRRVVISTYSKTLQHQLMEKDLPFLNERLGLDFRYAMAMGSANYLCRRRFENYIKFDRFATKTEAKMAVRLAKWALKTETAAKSELSFEVPQSTWEKISREPDLCFRGGCPFAMKCGFMRERAKLNESHILVVNHHMFFANLSAGETILPKYDAVIFDEAHNLEEAAISYFGIKATNSQIKYLADNIYAPKTGRGFLARIKAGDEKIVDLKMELESLRTKSEQFFRNAEALFRGKRLPARIREKEWTINTLSPQLRRVGAKLKSIKNDLDDVAEVTEASAYMSRAKDLASSISSTISLSEDGYVYWIDEEKNGRTSLNAAPINAAELLGEALFNGGIPIVLTSATLTSENEFGYLKERLGIDEADELRLESPFDYRKNALMYMPSDLPDPAKESRDFEDAAAVRIRELAEISGGGCMALFTSRRHMESAREYLEECLEGMEILTQGDKPQYKLIEDFKESPNAILLGTSSFWQGVDIPGNALKMVIIVKLPFAAPDDPITEARCDHIEENGGNSFMEFSVPSAIIWLKQGFGRLIRTASDRGVAAILDKRVMTKSYGRKFVKSLPKMLYTTRLEDVRSFMGDCR